MHVIDINRSGVLVTNIATHILCGFPLLCKHTLFTVARLGWAVLSWAGLGWAVLCCAELGWAELGWAGLGWAVLGWVGLACAGLGGETRHSPSFPLTYTVQPS